MCFNTRLGGEWRVTGKRGRTEWREPRVINLRSVQIPLTCRDKDAPFLQVQSEHLPAEGLMTCLGVGVVSALPAPAVSQLLRLETSSLPRGRVWGCAS